MNGFDRMPVVGDKRVAVRVTDDALRWIRSGHPWVFEDSVTSASDGEVGDLAVVFDRKRKFRAIGLYDPASPIRVKVLHQGSPTTIDDDWWRTRVHDVLQRRRALLDDPATTGIRLVNGENDGLPGFVADLYADVIVVKLYTPAWLPHLRAVVEPLVDAVGADTVVLRMSRRTQGEVPADVTDGMTLIGDLPSGPVMFLENGLNVEADPVAGQKTGYFLDQRDNRRRVGDMSRGKRVLDVFSAGGGFSLAAAAGGAKTVTSVDLSGPALDAVRRNFSHNRDLDAVRNCRHDTRHGDAFEVMADLAAAGKRFDIVVVDPPSFAQKADSVPGALRAYERLAELAVRLVDDGGTLVQASCSSRVTPPEFFGAVHAGARRGGVRLEELDRTGHAADHVIGFQYGEYLKALFSRVARR